jgi:hypothetical protein
MQALEDLAHLRIAVDAHGDYDRSIANIKEMQKRIASMTREKMDMELRIAELADACHCIEKSERLLLSKQKSCFVNCRRATLCAGCQAMIEENEEVLMQQQLRRSHGSKDLIEDQVPPLLHQSWHKDPSALIAQRTPSDLSAADRGREPYRAGAKGWRVLRNPDGTVVYHNLITNQSTLTRPSELYPTDAL